MAISSNQAGLAGHRERYGLSTSHRNKYTHIRTDRVLGVKRTNFTNELCSTGLVNDLAQTGNDIIRANAAQVQFSLLKTDLPPFYLRLQSQIKGCLHEKSQHSYVSITGEGLNLQKLLLPYYCPPLKRRLVDQTETFVDATATVCLRRLQTIRVYFGLTPASS